MTSIDRNGLSFSVPGSGEVSAVLLVPPRARALYAFAHGAGAGMEHTFMEATATRFAGRGIATFRYNFPYTEAGKGRPDRRPVLQATVRAAVDAAAAALPDVPLIAGGKSMGGRMTSMAQAESPLPGVRGLVFIAFPLHPAGKPATERAAHLGDVELPMLFLQGTRDALADLELIRGVCGGLGERAILHVVDGADHGFHVLKRSGRTDGEVLDELVGAVEEWLVRNRIAEADR